MFCSTVTSRFFILGCVVYQEGEQSPVQLGRHSRQGETQQAVVVLLKGFMVGTNVARRCVAPSVEGEKKANAKEKKHL